MVLIDVMNTRSVDGLNDAVSRVKGYGLLAYQLVESIAREGFHDDAESAARVIYEGLLDVCDNLEGLLYEQIEGEGQNPESEAR